MLKEALGRLGRILRRNSAFGRGRWWPRLADQVAGGSAGPFLSRHRSFGTPQTMTVRLGSGVENWLFWAARSAALCVGVLANNRRSVWSGYAVRMACCPIRAPRGCTGRASLLRWPDWAAVYVVAMGGSHLLAKTRRRVAHGRGGRRRQCGCARSGDPRAGQDFIALGRMARRTALVPSSDSYPVGLSCSCPGAAPGAVASR